MDEYKICEIVEAKLLALVQYFFFKFMSNVLLGGKSSTRTRGYYYLSTANTPVATVITSDRY